MKRRTDDDDEGSRDRSRSRSRSRSRDRDRQPERTRKRSREEEVDVRLLISSKAAGAIIGRGGESIKSLRSDFAVTVNIADSTTPERVLSVGGQESNVIRAVRECGRKINDDLRSRPAENELRVMVHASHAGAIIGRGGVEIKRLRDETRTNIKVYSECCPNSTERVVQIIGDIDDIMDCIRSILHTCIQTEIRGQARAYDTLNYDEYAIAAYGGYEATTRDSSRRSIGLHSSGGGFGGGNNRAPMPPPRSRGSVGGGSWGGGGMSQSRGSTFDRFDRFDRGGGGRLPPPPSSNRNDRGRDGDRFGGGGFGRDPPPRRSNAPIETTQVTIPDELAGTVIGKRGARINEIRGESGAEINIGPPLSGGDRDRIITISGTASQIQLAQYLLQQCVRDSPAGRKYIADQQGR